MLCVVFGHSRWCSGLNLGYAQGSFMAELRTPQGSRDQTWVSRKQVH